MLMPTVRAASGCSVADGVIAYTATSNDTIYSIAWTGRSTGTETFATPSTSITDSITGLLPGVYQIIIQGTCGLDTFEAEIPLAQPDPIVATATPSFDCEANSGALAISYNTNTTIVDSIVVSKLGYTHTIITGTQNYNNTYLYRILK